MPYYQHPIAFIVFLMPLLVDASEITEADLFNASRNGTLDVFQTYCMHGGDILSICSRPGRYTLLMQAVRFEQIGVIDLILNQKSDPKKLSDYINLPDSLGNTALHRAAGGSNAGVVKQLLEAGANINQMNYGEKETALHLVLAKDGFSETTLEGKKQIFDALLKNKANLIAKNRKGETPHHYAAKLSEPYFFCALSQINPDLLLILSRDKSSPCDLALLYNRFENVKQALLMGALPTILQSDFSLDNKQEVEKKLISINWSWHPYNNRIEKIIRYVTTTYFTRSIFFTSLQKGNASKALEYYYLLKRPLLRDEFGNTPLHWGACYMDEKTFLLTLSLNPRAVIVFNNREFTPIHCLVAVSRFRLLALIIKFLAN